MSKKRRGRGLGKDGRSFSGPPFARLPYFVMDSLAYRSLKCGPRALLLEIIRRYNGRNNGQIGLGVREAATALNLADKDTVNAYFRTLQECGLIRATRRGGFNMKDPASRRASEWALTWEKVCDAPPNKDFIAWGKRQAAEAGKTTVRKDPRAGPEKRALRVANAGAGPEKQDQAA